MNLEEKILNTLPKDKDIKKGIKCLKCNLILFLKDFKSKKEIKVSMLRHIIKKHIIQK